MPRNESPPRGRAARAPADPVVPAPPPPAVAPRPPDVPLPEAADQAPVGDATMPDAAEEPASAPADASETELKLVTDGAHLSVFRDAPVIAANARNRGVRRHLRSVYYDTADRRLRKAGFSLRVRRSGSRFTQTVKTEFGRDGLRRGEWEAEVPSALPDLALALPLLPEKLRSRLSAEDLLPVFAGDIHRHTRVVGLPTGTVEVAFDQGLLEAGGRTLAVDEVELELKAGSAHTLYDLALRLLEHGPVRPSLRTKSDRGFDLADGTPPAAPKPPRLDLDPEAPVDDAFAAILRGSLVHLLRSIPGAEDGRDPEGIHQARVGLRRLRSAFGLMRTVADSAALDSFSAEGKWLAANLGAARDGDIFATATLPSIAAALPGVEGFEGLGQLAEAQRAAGYATARAALSGGRASRFILELGGWIEQHGWRGDLSADALGALGDPAIAFAGRTLAALHARVLKRGRHFSRMTTEERHALRIAVKKLRYATDFLMPLFGPRKSKRFASELARLQDELGRYNDMATTRTIMAGFAADPAGRSPAAGAVIGWQAHALAAAEPRLRAAWRRFREAAPPWPEPA